MEELIEEEKTDDFDKSIYYIKRTIKRDILSSIAGQRGVYEYLTLRTDKSVRKAVEILKSKEEYTKLLSNGQKKAQLN